MKHAVFAAGAMLALALSTPVQAENVTTKDQIVGTWQVLSLKTTSEGNISYPLGEHPTGYVTFTPARMWLVFASASRTTPASPTLTDAEAAAAMKTHVAWTGKYTTAEQTPEGIKIVAHVDTASSQAIKGADRVYFVKVDGNRISVKSPAVIVPMTGKLSVVEFEMEKAD